MIIIGHLLASDVQNMARKRQRVYAKKAIS